MKRFIFTKQWVIGFVAAGALLAVSCTGGSSDTKETAPAPGTGAVSTGPVSPGGAPVGGPGRPTGAGIGAPQPVVANGAGAAVSSVRSLPPASFDTGFSTAYGYPLQASSFQSGIVVTGIGMKNVQADQAKVNLGVESRDKTVAAAREAAAQAMTRVRDALKGLGVAEKDILTTSFSIYPETIWVEITDSLGKRGQPKIIGYVVQNQVEVTVRKMDDVGKVVDAAADKGGDLIRVNSISFTLADPNAHAVSMRELAAGDAKAKAEIYAKAMGVKLGPLVFLSELQSSSPVVQKDFAVARAFAAEAAAPTPISPGEIDLTTTITAVFSITP